MANTSQGPETPEQEEDWRSTILRRELLRHARSVEQLAARFEEAEDYPTDTAVTFCKLINKTAGLIASRLNSAPVEKLRYIYTVLVSMGQYLRFAERSRIDQTPWSMIQAAEAFLKRHTPEECRFILRPQWSYNYSIRSGFIESLRACFGSLIEWMPLSEWENAIGDIGKYRIYCISFPRVERMNVLMHVSWGHEVGHIHASNWLDTRFAVLWKNAEDKIKQSLRAHWDEETANSEHGLLRSAYADQYVSGAMKETMEFAQSGLKELISDFVGAHLLGPAALACLGAYSVRSDLDMNPCQCGRYPPWRMRLRKMSEVVAGDLIEEKLFASHAQWRTKILPYVHFLQQVNGLTSSSDDKIEIDADIRTRLAYQFIQHHWILVRKEVISLLPKESQAPYQLKNRLGIIHELVLRLNQGIPPNETGTWPDTDPASLPDIWNAAWAFSRLRLDEDEKWGTPNNFDDLFRLTLKAIEASYVHSTFGPELRLVAEHEHIK